ncbi:MAG TPA: hypothetical protein ACFYD4_10400 [Candidatus Wunengus sp. YC61]|uniref:hypothetical protein n=1 Tax=Candidatus Wunengus sp. YC61 TaxID=3367698 RepID=UPI0040285DCF
MHKLYNLDKMAKKHNDNGNGGGAVRLSVSVSAQEKKFIEDNQLSPSRLLRWALEQKGFKKTKK